MKWTELFKTEEMEFSDIPNPEGHLMIEAIFRVSGKGVNVEPFGCYTQYSPKVQTGETSIEPFMGAVRRRVTRAFREVRAGRAAAFGDVDA